MWYKERIIGQTKSEQAVFEGEHIVCITKVKDVVHSSMVRDMWPA